MKKLFLFLAAVTLCFSTALTAESGANKPEDTIDLWGNEPVPLSSTDQGAVKPSAGEDLWSPGTGSQPAKTTVESPAPTPKPAEAEKKTSAPDTPSPVPISAPQVKPSQATPPKPAPAAHPAPEQTPAPQSAPAANRPQGTAGEPTIWSGNYPKFALPTKEMQMYKSASSKAPTLPGTLFELVPTLVTAQQGKWYKVVYDGLEGWVPQNDMLITDLAFSTGNNVNVRTFINEKVKGKMASGDNLLIIASSMGKDVWNRVYNWSGDANGVGWISEKYVTKVASEPAAFCARLLYDTLWAPASLFAKRLPNARFEYDTNASEPLISVITDGMRFKAFSAENCNPEKKPHKHTAACIGPVIEGSVTSPLWNVNGLKVGDSVDSCRSFFANLSASGWQKKGNESDGVLEWHFANMGKSAGNNPLYTFSVSFSNGVITGFSWKRLVID